MSTDIDRFIEHALEKGMDAATIRMILLSAGWKEKDVVEALAKTSLDLPVPAPPDHGGAREAFFHVLLTAAFYSALLGVIVILFQAIDRLLPDAAFPQPLERWQLSTIRWSLAFVIVSFPTFLGLSRLLQREMLAQPERSWSRSRRWLAYLTLFLASIALAIDLITLLYFMLEGELTARFVAKVLVVLVLAALTFSYYILSLRTPVDAPGSRRVRRAFTGAALLIVAGTLVWGLAIAGSPESERARKVDERRVRDLAEIRDEIQRLCLGTTNHLALDRRALERPLPISLGVLASEARTRRPDIVDPETGEPYGYEILSPTRFRVGASFRTVRDEEYQPFWNHEAAWTWFECDLLAD